MTPISPTTTVRDLLRAYPQAFPVLLGHGLCADCEANPPEVPLSHFASKHYVMRLNEVIQKFSTQIKDHNSQAKSSPVNYLNGKSK